MAKKGFTPDTLTTAYERTGGRCERCGRWSEYLQGHHRQKRRHGNHTIHNSLMLDMHCHDWVHKNEKEAQELGMIVASWDDPETTNIFTHNGWVNAITREGA